MTKHTPGPWRVEAMGYSHYQVLSDKTDIPSRIIGVIHDPTDARLIAAAPDLLAALTHLAGGADHSWDTETGPHINDMVRNARKRLIAKARAAIAKATGESK